MGKRIMFFDKKLMALNFEQKFNRFMKFEQKFNIVIDFNKKRTTVSIKNSI